MHNPIHPGKIVKWECLEPLGLTVTRAAQGLGVTRQALSDLVNERAGVSVEMAHRLSQAFGSTPETWLRMQMAHDLWQSRERAKHIKVERFAAPSLNLRKVLCGHLGDHPKVATVRQLPVSIHVADHAQRLDCQIVTDRNVVDASVPLESKRRSSDRHVLRKDFLAAVP